jgi:hypothetical protein
MFKINAQQLGKIGMKNMGNFTSIAKDFVKFGVTVEGNENMDDNVQEFMTETFSLGMAMGAEVVRKPYIITGIAMGVVGTIATSKISNVFKKKREEEELSETIREYNDYIVNELEKDNLKIKKK